MENNAEELSLKETAEVLWSRRWLITCLTLSFAVMAVCIALILPVKYETSVKLAPATDDGSGKLGGAGALLSQFGGLAALGGFNIGGAGKGAEAVAVLQSAALTEAFIRENKLLPILFSDEWDDTRQSWKSADPDDQPTLWKAEKKFSKKIRSVSEEKKTGILTLTITWKDPAQAANWANELVKRTNLYLRARAIEQSKKNLDYLNDQLAKTNVVELQKAIYGLTESEIKKIMIANGSDGYAFRIIDPARPPEERSSPKRAQIALAGTFVGLILGVILALMLQRKES
jgi:uncharacterized protein involved in exopolysaccharide biosynthesis